MMMKVTLNMEFMKFVFIFRFTISSKMKSLALVTKNVLNITVAVILQ